MGGGRRRAGRVHILDAAGYEIVIVETVGVGEDEVDIARAAHTTVVVSAPGLGDDVQVIKAGILEDRRDLRRREIRPVRCEKDRDRLEVDAGNGLTLGKERRLALAGKPASRGDLSHLHQAERAFLHAGTRPMPRK